jgi:hypothetical protein
VLGNNGQQKGEPTEPNFDCYAPLEADHDYKEKVIFEPKVSSLSELT